MSRKQVYQKPDGSIGVRTLPKPGAMEAQQQFKDKCNINEIMRKYHKTGMIDHLRRSPGQYADLTQIKDYDAALNTVINARQSFMTLPSEVRSRFQNEPQALINFLQDEKNYEEGVKLGLLKARPVTPPVVENPEKK